MELVTLEDARNYLRVDYTDEDALIGNLVTSATVLCVDVARFDAAHWEDVLNENTESEYFTIEEIAHIRSLMKVAILYSLAYLYEHREEADHAALTLTLRSILFSIRETTNL